MDVFAIEKRRRQHRCLKLQYVMMKFFLQKN